MEKCLISILMPVFKPNIEWLEIALNSMIKQTYDNFELLLLYEPVERDGVRELVKTIADDRIIIIETPEKSGLPRSLNIGLKNSRGKYIARMDADDYSLPQRLEKQILYMESHHDVDVLGTPVKIMGKNKYLFNERINSMQERIISFVFSNSGGVAHPTAMFRKSFFDRHNIKYNEDLRGSEDYCLWADIVSNGGILYTLEEPLLEYRLSDIQASKRYEEQMVSWDFVAKNKIYKYIYGDDKDLNFDLWSKLCCSNKSINDDIPKLLDAFNEMRNNNERFPSEIRDCYNKEIEFWWMFKAILQTKNGFGIKMFYPKYFFRVVEIKNLAYIIIKLIRKLLYRYIKFPLL